MSGFDNHLSDGRGAQRHTSSDAESGREEAFDLPDRYVELCPLGRGGYGMAKDVRRNRLVAIKRLIGPFSSAERAKCCFREVHLLRCLHHPNLVKLHDAFVSECGEDLFMVMDYMPNDLRSIIGTGEALSLPRIRRIMYQLLQSLQYLHALGIVHRDLKPENVLLSATDELKVCDLGLARRTEAEMTGYLATRYYRAPEFMLTWRTYGPPVDMWSAGCILAEMATGRLLFPGVDHVHHLRLIIELVGHPSDAVLSRICSPSTQQYLKMLPRHPKADFYATFGWALGAEGCDLLERLLEFDPAARITPAEALRHAFLAHVEEADGAPRKAAAPPLPMEEHEGEVDWPARLRQELDHHYGVEAKDA